MRIRLLIIFIVLIAIFAGLSLSLCDSSLLPGHPFYSFKLVGEWLDANFLIIGAPEKQAKHLELSQRRLDEYLRLGVAQKARYVASLGRAYEDQLASAEFMAEQLTLLDRKFLPMIEKVYSTTLEDLELLYKASPLAANELKSPAQLYNRNAIKNLLQKHQNGPSDTDRYKKLIETRLTWEESLSGFSSQQIEQLRRATTVLGQGKELEWAYDLMSSVLP